MDTKSEAKAAQPPSLPTPEIVGLEELFRDHAAADPEACNFPCGSTLVISGPPGAGKTTLALALVRSMIRGGDNGNGAAPKHIAYYISTEVNRSRLKQMFQSRGWFEDENQEKDDLFAIDPTPTETGGLHIINPPLEIERPVKTSEELVNYIVRQIAIQPQPQSGQKVFIIVDSVTALFKDCQHPGEGRRQAHELTHRLKQQFTGAGKPLGMILLLAEQGIDNMESPGMETYVADFVFSLALKSLNMGTRLRTVEVSKSQGANLMMGIHTWAIVTHQSLHRIVAAKALQDDILSTVARAEGVNVNDLRKGNSHEGRKWGTVVLFHRPYFQPAEAAYTDKPQKGKKAENEPSGLQGLDQMLRLDPDYWFSRPDDNKNEGYSAIVPGAVTVVVGEAGTGKTSICCIFAARHLKRHENGKVLLIGFEEDFEKTGKEKLKDILPCLKARVTENCETIYRSRSGLHFNMLLSEIRAWLNQNPDTPKRVIIDGISNLAATHSKEQFSQMLDALIYLFEHYPTRSQKWAGDGTEHASPSTVGKDEKTKSLTCASVLLTYEVPQTASIYDLDVFRFPASNIVVLSHKEIENSRRTAVRVVKSQHSCYDTMTRELVLVPDALLSSHIKSGFDAYSDVLSEQVKKASVVLQLFQENKLEGGYNKALGDYLARLLPYRVSLRNFSRFEISAILNAGSEHIRIPGGNVLITSMDEWWLSHKAALIKRASEKLGPDGMDAAKQEADKHHLVSLAGFIRADDAAAIKPGDFWCFEMEKCWRLGKDAQSHFGPYAVPSFLDFGMLCVHYTLLEEFVQSAPQEEAALPLCWDNSDEVPWPALKKDTPQRASYAEWLRQYLVPWCNLSEDREWFEKPQKSGAGKETLVDKMNAAQTAQKTRYGFAWDSRTTETSASMLYELAWAFGGSEDLFAGRSAVNEKAVKLAFSFIGFLVQEGLMPACPTLTDTSEAAFSRHYYSTFMDVCLRQKDLQKKNTKEKVANAGKLKNKTLHALGFMPPGPLILQTEKVREADENKRVRKVRERMIAMGEKLPELTGSLDENRQVVFKAWVNARKKQEWNDPAHYYNSPNPGDIDELIRWMKFREKLGNSTDWKAVLEANGEIDSKQEKKLRVGHGCCGAWMTGVKSPTASPGIAQVVLQEITSLTLVKKRARMGAGLPARRDFYQHYGDRPVTGIGHLSWNEMLSFCGSTARRRDRIYGNASDETPDPAAKHREIHHYIDRVMLAAAASKNKQTIQKLAQTFTERLFGGSPPYEPAFRKKQPQSLKRK